MSSPVFSVVKKWNSFQLGPTILHSQVDLFSLQKLLGHSSIESTAIYLHVDLTRLRAAVASHPMA